MSAQQVSRVVGLMLEGYISYISTFNELTSYAPKYFKNRDWTGMQQVHKRRLRLYKYEVNATRILIRGVLRDEIGQRQLWREVKANFAWEITTRKDKELAESFFNSVVRKTVPDTAVDEEIMFVHEGYDTCDIHPQETLYHTYPPRWGLEKIMRKIVEDFDFEAPYLDKEADIRSLVQAVRSIVLTRYKPDDRTITQVLKSVFYRNKAAYLIGRTYVGEKWMPFVIPFMHGPRGIYVDTLIFEKNLMSGLFSYTRSYFMVETAIPSQLISFLLAVINHKKIHELYNAIGFNKHGKTEFYRDFIGHLAQSKDQFILAPGIKGMVMTVFTLPSYNIVFKLIKDYFDPPKSMTRQEVKDKYVLVSRHDRVGRMADTHEFESFHFPLERISPELLEELRRSTNSLLSFTDKELIIQHLYTERRMIPLNIYLETCSHDEAKHAVEEYGLAIIQLAKANIFPGDMMTKNFGVTRQRRVVFYDYDEIEFLTDMNFRWKPKPQTYEQIYASEPWYEIAPNDVFPEDFKRFMIGRADVRQHFISYHTRLFDPEYWIDIQQRIRRGELLHVFPYPRSYRFRPEEEV